MESMACEVREPSGGESSLQVRGTYLITTKAAFKLFKPESDHQRSIKVNCSEMPVLQYLKTTCLGDAVEPQAILQRINFGEQFTLQSFEPGNIQLALKN